MNKNDINTLLMYDWLKHENGDVHYRPSIIVKRTNVFINNIPVCHFIEAGDSNRSVKLEYGYKAGKNER